MYVYCWTMPDARESCVGRTSPYNTCTVRSGRCLDHSRVGSFTTKGTNARMVKLLPSHARGSLIWGPHAHLSKSGRDRLNLIVRGCFLVSAGFVTRDFDINRIANQPWTRLNRDFFPPKTAVSIMPKTAAKPRHFSQKPQRNRGSFFKNCGKFAVIFLKLNRARH